MMATQRTSTEFIDAGRFIVEVYRSSRRKTAQIRVESGLVSVVAPESTPVERLEEVVQGKRQWILQKLAVHREAQPVRTRSFISGEALPYLGRNYRLKVERGPYAPVKLSQGRLHVQLPNGSEAPQIVRNAVVRWYRANALKRLKQKTQRYSEIIGVEPRDVSVREFKSRWGSCTAKGEVHYNWRIVMAPNRMCDYVVVHELCHLVNHDHSARFWQHVERILPDYEECRAWLKKHAEHFQI